MAQDKICPICRSSFQPSKYRKSQKICSRQSCQRKRQLQNLAAWRAKNPGYFKTRRHDSSWADIYRKHAKQWRKKHKKKIKHYKQVHKQEQREYMREYMHRLRRSTVKT